VTAFPDWFHPNIGSFWTNEFKQFFSPSTGVDIDGVWIDMNEPANFCNYPCNDPEGAAIEQMMPPSRLPPRDPPRTIPGFPSTGNATKSSTSSVTSQTAEKKIRKRQEASVDLINPPYSIANDAPLGLSDRTVHTDIVHYGGLTEYDTHNLYGTSKLLHFPSMKESD
jgi:alpha-glucosidase